MNPQQRRNELIVSYLVTIGAVVTLVLCLAVSCAYLAQ